MSKTRELNDAQERCLDRLAKKDPKAIVIDWFEGVNRRGPIVLLEDGTKKLINASGYAIAHS
jgi:hypothetical protein